jgi:RHS repeat-associated protein
MGAENLIGYTGALTDLSTDVTGIASTGYVHLGNRWYNPATGSFTTQDTNSYLSDPANGNRYAYAADNPANYTDPTGQFGWGDVIGIGLAVAVAGVGLAFAGLFTANPVLLWVGLGVAIAGLGVTVETAQCENGGSGSSAFGAAVGAAGCAVF